MTESPGEAVYSSVQMDRAGNIMEWRDVEMGRRSPNSKPCRLW